MRKLLTAVLFFLLVAPLTITQSRTPSSSEGAEVAEIYVGQSHARVPRPIKELKGFALKPGETRHLQIALDRRAFSYYDVNRKDWTAEPGEFAILVGGSSDNTRCEALSF